MAVELVAGGLVVVLTDGLGAVLPADAAAAATGSHATAPFGSTPWTWPITMPHPILRPYLAPATPYGPGHRGIDIGVSNIAARDSGSSSSGASGSSASGSSASGSGASGYVEPSRVPVLAPADGVVSFAGVVVDRPVLSIRHAGGLVSSYEPVVTTLVAGDSVARGQQIGELQAGHCAELCLHFGVRLDGAYISPLNYLGGIPWSVLLPTR